MNIFNMNWYIVDKAVIHLAWHTCHDVDAANISVRSCLYFMSYSHTQDITSLHCHEDWGKILMKYYAHCISLQEKKPNNYHM